jgi:putative redox protein
VPLSFASSRRKNRFSSCTLCETVGIENVTKHFLAAKHHKSFASVDTADHLLSDPAHAALAGQAMAGWL